LERSLDWPRVDSLSLSIPHNRTGPLWPAVKWEVRSTREGAAFRLSPGSR